MLQENAWAYLSEAETKFGTGNSWQEMTADEVVDGTGKVLHAGLFDTHCHGGAGNAANRGIEDIKGILDFNLANQVNRTVVSLVSADVSAMVQIANDAKSLKDDPRFVGLHFEGPFLSHDHKGAQDPGAIKLPTDSEIEAIIATGTVASITLAPEHFSESQLEMLEKAGIRLCFGHSGADYDVAVGFFQKHPQSVMTHTYNGMKGIHHREPGPVPAAIETDTFMELIADGIHVHPAAARLIPKDRLILVTDAIEATGRSDGDYLLGALPIKVTNGVARTSEGSIAGSTLLLTDAVRTYADWSEDLGAALAAATSNPEKAYGVAGREISLQNQFLL